ncbi:gp72 [Burkholderia phage BcepB1A]|uniref:gp72 n=1 Tax=Burkholderia phage BcepB1A TaxID=279530 RepID=UPI00003779B7|nr:gp72 [Burkholderia phage BcepB1A]AAT37764.1 gp72 [Burkholderia phage BcepB1A]
MILHWPQITYLALTLFGLGLVAAQHGKPNGRHNLFASGITTGLTLFLLWKGGFFG